MRADIDIKRDVEAELLWSPELDQTDIAVKVNEGIVTLSGYAKSYFEKYRAEAAVKRIAGRARSGTADGLGGPWRHTCEG